MIYTIRNIAVRLVITATVLTIYIMLLNTPVIEAELPVSVPDELTYLQISNIMNGTRRYSVLGLNIAPTMTVMLLMRILPMLVGLFSNKAVIQYNTDKYLSYQGNKMFLYIAIASVIEGLLYIHFIVKKSSFFTINMLLSDAAYYAFYLFVIVIGSFIVYALTNIINLYGVGKGIYCITVVNFLLAIYNILDSYAHNLSMLTILLVIMQCMACLYTFYIFDTYVFKIKAPIIFDKRTNEIIYNRSCEYAIYLSTATGILPLIYTHIFMGLYVNNISSIFDILICYITQYLILFLFYILLNRLFRTTEKHTKTVRQNKVVFANLKGISLIFTYLVPFLQVVNYYRFFTTCVIMFFSQWSIVLTLILGELGFSICNNTISIYSLYYINTLFMFMFLLTVRLLLLIYYTTDLCILKMYFDRNR
uniref:SecY-type transporter protein n=1 Tax=Histiona aroides TaxID=392300 RepID=M4QKR5_HISAR|nr:SecY-type transporter protein [Histiona aroides]AGH24058.1 SecY-type transporter protein [Histiona aroides]